MLLPSQLPNRFRDNNKNNNRESNCECERGRQMARKGRSSTDRAEMLASNSPQPCTSLLQAANPGFVARSWARISGRRRRQRRRATEWEERRHGITAVAQQPNGPGSARQQRPNAGNLAGLAHLEDSEERRERHFLGLSMDRLRRSLRRSLHRGGQSGQALTQPSSASSGDTGLPSSCSISNGTANGIAKGYCHGDELSVRSTACSFPVKYLGTCEVFESRGMSVCESALQHLRSRKRSVKALLYVSGDGIRVVDQESSRGLVVDQTIEKVSFCSPDRHNDKGFAYICRDGATRRWMCHGFQAVRDSGERLSHAVGCAFNVCLEKKRKRDAESAAYRNAQALAQSLNDPDQSPPRQPGEPFARTNAGYSSFRHLSISERRADPQKAIVVAQSQRPQCAAAESAATPRPSGNPNLFERAGSLRAPAANNPPPLPSLMPSFCRSSSMQQFGAEQRRNTVNRMTFHNEPIWEGEDGQETETAPMTDRTGGQFGDSRFYRTMPHSLPNFHQTANNCNFTPSKAISPVIPEEDSQLARPSDGGMAKSDENNSLGSASLADQLPEANGGIANNSQLPVQADDWLEQTLQRVALSRTMPRSLTMELPREGGQQSKSNWAQFPHPQSLRRSISDWPDGTFGEKGPPPNQPPPPLPSRTAHALENGAVSPRAEADPQTGRPTVPAARRTGQQEQPASTDTLAKSHSRKASGSRRIEYQLLQETDVSLSPPKSGSGLLDRAMGRNGGKAGGQQTVDPFDVNWSQKILEETAKQRSRGVEKANNSPVEQRKNEPNPFGWESAPVNV